MRAFFSRHKILRGVIVLLLAAHFVRLIVPNVSDSFSLTATHPRDWLEYLKDRWTWYQYDLEQRAKQREIDTLTKYLSDIDEVGVYTLGDEDTTLTSGFPLRGGTTFAQIKTTKTLHGDDVKQLVALWKSREFSPCGESICASVRKAHLFDQASHGLRFSARGKLTLETSVYWRTSTCDFSEYSDHDVLFLDEDSRLLDLICRLAPPAPYKHLQLLLHTAESERFSNPKVIFGFLDQIRTLDPHEPIPEIFTGDYALRHGDWDNALFYYDKAIQKDSSSFDGLFARGQWYAWQGEYNQAIQDFDEALPDGSGLFLTRPLSHFSLNELRGLCRLANQDIAGGINDFCQMIGFASEEFLLRHIERRRDALAESLEQSPRSLDLQRSLSLVQAASDQLRQSIQQRHPPAVVSPDGELRCVCEMTEYGGIEFLETIIFNRAGAELCRWREKVAADERWVVVWGENHTVWLAHGTDTVCASSRGDETTWLPVIDPRSKFVAPDEINRFLVEIGEYGWSRSFSPEAISDSAFSHARVD